MKINSIHLKAEVSDLSHSILEASLRVSIIILDHGLDFNLNFLVNTNNTLCFRAHLDIVLFTLVNHKLGNDTGLLDLRTNRA